MGELEYAWAAGLIDGEGYIDIGRNGQLVTVNGLKAPNYTIMLTVSMCEEATVRRLQQMFDRGAITVNHKQNPKHRDAYAWRCFGDDVACILRRIHPYIFTKKWAADLALEFASFGHLRGGPASESRNEIVRKRAGLYKQFQEAKSNRRGGKCIG